MRKFRNKQKTNVLSLTMLLLLSILLISQPLTVQAGEEDADVTDLVHYVNSTGGGGGGGTGTVPNGMKYTRTGYLCYLVNNDTSGGDAGYPAYAFTSPGYSQLGGTQWIIKSRKDHTVSSWKTEAPWGCTPFKERDASGYVGTNEPDIKAWFNLREDGKLNSQKFVQNTWGPEAAEAFQSDEIAIVVETLINCQFAERTSTADKLTSEQENKLKVQSFSVATRRVNNIKNLTVIKNWCRTYGVIVNQTDPDTGESLGIDRPEKDLRSDLKHAYADHLKKLAREKILEDMNKESGAYKSIGQPVLGTLPNLLDYRNNTLHSNTNCFDSYVREVIPKSERIEKNDCGFTAYTGGWKMSEGDIPKYGVAMMIIHCKDDATIKTYWEPNGSPGKPEPAKPNKTGTCAIVKGYYEENETTGVKTSLGVFCEKDTTNNIQIMDEPGFELVRWDISTVYNDALDPTDWNPPSSLRDGKNPETVKLETPEKVVYVLLKRTLEEEEEAPADVNYTLSQSTITRQIHISTPDNQLTMPKIQDHEFIWKLLGHVVKCSGHRCDGHEVTKSGSHDSDCPSDCTSSHSYTDTEYHDNVYCSNWTWFDDKLVFSLKNEQKENFPDVLATKGGWENVTSLKGLVLWVQPFTRTIPEETLKGYKNLDYACVLLRGKDKLTVAEWKNTDLNASAANSDLREVSSAGFCIGNTLMGSRKTADYKDNFTVSIVDNSVDNTTKYGATKDAQASCGQTWSATHTNTIKGIQIEKFDIPVSVQLDVYSGSPDKGINDTTCATGRQNHKVSGFNKSNGIEIKYNATIDFLPYVQMNYDTYTEKYRTAYVLGEHKRSITPNAYAEISWNETAGENLKLSSLQWSTHKSATDKWGAGNVLPGGAALTISIPSSDRQKIVLTSYQVILEGSGKTQVENTGGSVGEFTREKAIELHQAYVDSVVKGYESLCVEQWVNTNTTNPAWNGGKAVHEGDDISFISSGLHASEDSKYYFRKDGEQGGISAGEGDLDVEDHGISLTDTYTFFTNTYGEVRYIKNNVNPNIGNEKMGELASGGMADFLNKRTHIVDKLTVSVEHGTGQDKSYGIDGMRSKTGVNWYNEAMDGVTIIVQQSTITVGFKETGERTSILDPRLCKPNKNGQSGMFKDGSYSSSQYKCKDHTEVYGIKDKVGTFMNVDVYTESMDMLYKSKIFYIANVNTQDLH